MGLSSGGEFEGKVALIVGAGPGVGRACAAAFAREGASVVIAARRMEPLRRLADGIGAESGANVHAISADLADHVSCHRVIDSTVVRFGRLDAVVNVATASGGQSIDESDFDRWRRAFEINVLGTLEISRCAARVMGERGGGSIVQISSFGAHSLPERLASYTATKTAMVSASRTMAKEVGRRGVRVNVVTPGYTTGAPLTAMFERMANARGATVEEVSAELAGTAALRRHVDPDDVAEAVLFLSGPRARSITGVEVPVTAGQQA